MRQIIIISIFILTGNIYAQGTADSISMEMLYSNQVFYSLENGTTLSTDNNNWNIAFSLSGNGAIGSSILINEANSNLWSVPQDTSYWSVFDTTGYSGWEELLNSDTSWTNGAFNAYRGAAGFFDLGWGILDPSNNYWTFGDSLYLIKLGDGSFRKLWIESLKTGVWQFKYADVDGANENTVQITKSDYSNRNFIYFSFESESIIDREPDNTTWDITFFKHRDEVVPGMFVSVTGVFNNIGLWTGKSNEIDLNSALNATVPLSFNQNAINIGREWKNYSSGVWTVYDTIAYFAWNIDSTSLHRIVFTGFGGMSTGKAYFNINEVATLTLTSDQKEHKIHTYPNPANDFVIIELEEVNEECYFELFGLNGQLVLRQVINSEKTTIPLNSVPRGMYVYRITNSGSIKTGKILLE